MDLSLFATQVTKTAPLSGGGNPLFGNNGSGGINNLAFLEAILGNFGTDSEIKTEINNQHNLQTGTANDGIKKEKSDLALLQIALLGQDVDKNLDEKLADLKIETLVQTKENRIEQLTKLIDHLTSGLPQEVSSEQTIEDLVSRLNNRLEKLTTSLEAFRSNDFSDEGAPFKLLIATGLNPAQFTKITDRIEEVENKLGRELTVEDLIAGVGNIVPAPGEDDHEFSTTDALNLALKISKNTQDPNNEHRVSDNTQAPNNEHHVLDNAALPFASPNIESDVPMAPGKIKHYDMQALLNLIASNKIAPAGTPTNGLQPTVMDTTILPEDAITPLPQALSNTEFKALFGANNNGIAGSKNAMVKLAVANVTPQAAVPTLPMMGDLALPTNWTESLMSQQALSDALGFDVQTGAPFTQTMQAAHIATTATQSAGQTHPATSMVAAQISKAAQNGDTRNITLHLNPPELGRVEVHMKFGSDNQVKAHLIVEKPETYLMLQRDTAALERALQEAGMETGSDSLNYQMAEDNYGFGSENNDRNGNSGTENASHHNDEIEEEIIETTMNWNVDPDTGHVHYNIMA